ncbi:MAG: CPBP family intramembrane metalloprotease [Oscillospiraceae bacterium]|nr:CPBP family intramembrane metalloprotease [Oscillospiraceae bacterium]
MDNYQPLYGGGYDPLTVSKPEKKAIKKQLSDTFIMCLASDILMTIIAVAAFVLMEVFGYEFRTNESGQQIMDWQYSLAASLPSVLLCVLMFLCDKSMNKIKTADYLRTDRMKGSFIPAFIGVCMFSYAVALGLQALITGAFSLFDWSPLSESFYYETDLTPAFLAQELLTTVVLAPIAEELMFRGVVLRRLSKVSQSFGIIVSALFFGLMHGNILQTALGFVIGVVFAYADIKAGSLLPSIIGHMFINASATVSSFVEYFFGENAAGTVWMIMILLYFIVGLIVSLVLIFGKKIKWPANTEYHRKRTLPLMLTCISFWLLMALYIYNVVDSTGPLTDLMKE